MAADLNQLEQPKQAKSKKLDIGDKLCAQGSWNKLSITILSVDEKVAVSDRGFKFSRDFSNGDSYINRDLPFSIDLQRWILAD